MTHNHHGVKNPHYKHGMSGTRFYIIWKHINARCNNKLSHDYRYYGGRGVQTFWDTFQQFKEDMFESYKTHVKKCGEVNTTIDRINTDKSYYKGNCRWATRAEQSRNTRRTNMITFKGQTRCLADWARYRGMKNATLSNRIHLYKWSIDKALTTKVRT